jgi:hypothetical protein
VKKEMRTSMLLAVVGVVAVVAVAGAAVASGTMSGVLGLGKSDTGEKGSGNGLMHQWSHSWEHAYKYAGNVSDCPIEHDWNYSYEYDYDYETCPCSE